MPAGDRRFLSQGNQGTVYLTGSGSTRQVIKQAMGNALLRPLRRAMLRHEHAAYQRLAGLRGIPRCDGLGPDGELRLEYIAAEPFEEGRLPASERERFFTELLAVILSVHAAGVSHSDLKRRGNILIDEQHQPWLIDFGTAVLRRPKGGALNRLLFRHACRIDLNAWIKLKYRRDFGAISPADRQYYQPSWIESSVRWLRRGWRLLTRRRWRKARRQRRR